MGKNERLHLIQELEKKSDSRVLSYITGDKRGMETKISADIFPFVYEHLVEFGHVKRINLLLYSMGGDSVTGWGLVNLIREFCDEFIVTVPFKALSCATLIALGADQVLMGKSGQLSPIDPSVSSPYNPPAPGPQQPGIVTLLPVSVEDMMGYLDLAKNEVGVKSDESMSRIMEILASKVHPMSLGAVYRAREGIRTFATRLLGYHMKDANAVTRIVEKLTKELPSHQYLIGRREARDIGLPIVEPSPELERLLWDLQKEYATWLELTTPYNPEAILGDTQSTVKTLVRAVIESRKTDGSGMRTHAFKTKQELKRVQFTQPGIGTPTPVVQQRLLEEEWGEEI